jgi:uncharacterized protein (TIGR03089 family)
MQTNPETVVAAFEAMTRADATRPVLTFYDDASGERLDLSGATLGNWVAKTANLLVDGHGLGPGDVAAIRLPPHWLTAAVLLGCWSAGLAVDLEDDGQAAVGFVTADVPVDADEVYALALAPLGAPFRPGPPPGTVDYTVEVRGYGDHFSPRVAAADRALADGTTHGSLLADVAERSGGGGVAGLSGGGGVAGLAGGRVLIDTGRTPDPRRWLVAPLAAAASIVLCVNLDPSRLDARLAAERATAWP